MKKQRGTIDRDLVLFGVVGAGILVVVFSAAMFFANWACRSKWERSGRSYDWGPVQGCLIKMPNGAWIPEERYREIDP